MNILFVLCLFPLYGSGFLVQDNIGSPDGWTKFNDHCYLYNILRRTWSQAQSTCENFGGHLATIQDVEEDQFIRMFINESKTAINDLTPSYTWIGATDSLKEGTWVWVTGQPIGKSYTNWRGGGPSNGHHGSHDEDCLDYSNGWNDNDCSQWYHFICEKSLCTCDKY